MNMIAACCRGRGIGLSNRLPWVLEGDMRLFQRLTVGDGRNAVLMGKKTWLSLPQESRPLPKRTNFVLTSGYECHGARTVRSISEAVSHTEPFDKTWVIGGGEIYRAFLDHAALEKIYLTHIDADFEFDTQFPQIPKDFICIRSDRQDPECENGLEYWLEVYARNTSPPLEARPLDQQSTDCPK